MAESKKYQETIQHMKELKEEAYQKKNNDLKQKLKKKEMVLITSLETKQKDKMEEKRRIITEIEIPTIVTLIAINEPALSVCPIDTHAERAANIGASVINNCP